MKVCSTSREQYIGFLNLLLKSCMLYDIHLAMRFQLRNVINCYELLSVNVWYCDEWINVTETYLWVALSFVPRSGQFECGQTMTPGEQGS